MLGRGPFFRDSVSPSVDGNVSASWLCDLALREGFDLAGVTSPAPVATDRAFVDWIESGGNRPMNWLARRIEIRTDPSSYRPEAQAILVVAVDLLEGGRNDLSEWPGVARYAWFLDYHDWMLERLRRVAASIEQRHPGSRNWPSVDTAPVLERELAVRAGLGAMGKNTLLIHPERGSQLLLGELFTTVAVRTFSLPVSDLCGNCSRCLEACPTGALTPYRLDAEECLTTWTVEWKGVIPERFREAASEWWFGCDRCQEVCPWNRRARRPLPRPVARPDRLEPLDPVAILELDDEALGSRIASSCLSRPGLPGLRRNAAIALSRRSDARSERALIDRLLRDRSPVVRGTCGWSLARRGGTRGRSALAEALRREPDPAIREILAQSLST